MNKENIIGVDLGGTNIRAGLVNENNISQIVSRRINSSGSVDEILRDLFDLTDQIINNRVNAIGIGVPGVVDVEKGIVYDVINIPSWKEVSVRKHMEERYNIPVLVQNDANCFALGEYYFGKGIGHNSMIGLTIGTGIGGGIILNKKLYAGANCGAGEFGMVPYLDKYFEYYASGQFFKNIYDMDGQEVYQKAIKGDAFALNLYTEMGTHLGNAIKMILYTYDPDLIVIGGSLKNARKYFSDSMWISISDFAFPRSVKQLRIEFSELDNCGVLGAAALHLNEAGL
jgi:glucokinase